MFYDLSYEMWQITNNILNLFAATWEFIFVNQYKILSIAPVYHKDVATTGPMWSAQLKCLVNFAKSIPPEKVVGFWIKEFEDPASQFHCPDGHTLHAMAPFFDNVQHITPLVVLPPPSEGWSDGCNPQKITVPHSRLAMVEFD